MVNDQLVQSVQSRQCTYFIAAMLCLLFGSVASCTGKKGTTISVERARVSSSGVITLRVRIENSGGTYKYTELLKTGATELELGEAQSIGQHGAGQFVAEFANEFRTSDPSSVRFRVQEGQSVFVATGHELDLLEFAPHDEQAAPRDEQGSVVTRYVIRVR